MQQIHCLLNSLAHCISPTADARPLFFGAWDTPFAVEEDRLTYFSSQITNETYVSMFELLYEKKLGTWYDYQLSKEANYERLRNLAASVTPGEHLLVQLDLYYLRYETRSFGNIHQPHFVIVLHQQEGKWFLLDPYFGWEGALTEEEMQSAFFHNALGGGFFLDTANLHSPLKDAVCAQFEQEFTIERNQLAYETKELVRRFMNEPHKNSKAVLTNAFSQVGIISKRKWCYVQAFDYFSEAGAIHRDQQSFDEVEKLVKGWNAFGYLAIRASMGVTPLHKLLEKVEELELQERQLKEKLWNLYQGWRRAQST